MSVELDKDKLLTLIRVSLEEVIEADRRRNEWREDLSVLANNDMSLHRVMMSHLTMAGQVSMSYPLLHPEVSEARSISRILQCTDSFSEKLFTNIRKHALYYSLFSQTSLEFPEAVVEQVKELLRVPTESALVNDIDLRCSNIIILNEMMNKDTCALTYGRYVLTVASEKNGSTPFKRLYLKRINENYPNNSYLLQKGVYSYDIETVYLGNHMKESLNFSNDGTQVLDVPDDLLIALDHFISVLYKEYSSVIDVDAMLENEVNTISKHLTDIVNNCLPKFAPVKDGEEELPYAKQLDGIVKFIQQRFSWNRNYLSFTVSGRKVVGIDASDIKVSDDGESVLLQTEINAYTKSGQTYERYKISPLFDSAHGSTFMTFMNVEDFNTKLFFCRALDIVEKDMRIMVGESLRITTIDRYGYTSE